MSCTEGVLTFSVDRVDLSLANGLSAGDILLDSGSTKGTSSGACLSRCIKGNGGIVGACLSCCMMGGVDTGVEGACWSNIGDTGVRSSTCLSSCEVGGDRRTIFS
jgi:hypothetical protein